MYSFLAEKLIYPLGDTILGTSVMKYYQLLQETQWWPRQQLEELQNRKLRALIDHAYYNVPFYRKWFNENGMQPGDIQNISDLQRLPIVTKRDIRLHSQEMVPDDYKKWKPIVISTGGSTGEPLKFYITRDAASINWAGNFRGWGWGGYRLGDKRIKFGGSSIVPDKPPTLFEKARDKLERNLPLSVASVDAERFEKYLEVLSSFKPKYLYGYASSLYLFANHCKSHRIKNHVTPDGIFSTSEILLPSYRQTIEEQFKCKVFDVYGSYDGGGQAMECEYHSGFHISAEKTVMEVVDDEGNTLPPDESGRIIVTDLHNYAMPFIRYEVGDMGILSESNCPCGRGLPVLKTLEGRTHDIIRFRDGVVLSGLAISSLVKGVVQQFQVIQSERDKLLLKIVKNEKYQPKDTEYIKSAIRKVVGIDIQVDIEFCEVIKPVDNQKLKTVISEIDT